MSNLPATENDDNEGKRIDEKEEPAFMVWFKERKWMSGRGRKVMQRYSALPVELGSCSLQGVNLR